MHFAVGLVLLGVGILLMMNPSWVIKRLGNAYLRSGGELRKEWNRFGFEIFGAVLAVVGFLILFRG